MAVCIHELGSHTTRRECTRDDERQKNNKGFHRGGISSRKKQFQAFISSLIYYVGSKILKVFKIAALSNSSLLQRFCVNKFDSSVIRHPFCFLV